MFAEPGNTITYSLYAPASLVAGMSYAESYAYLDDWVIDALIAHFRRRYGLTRDGLTAGGAARRAGTGPDQVLH